MRLQLGSSLIRAAQLAGTEIELGAQIIMATEWEKQGLVGSSSGRKSEDGTRNTGRRLVLTGYVYLRQSPAYLPTLLTLT